MKLHQPLYWLLVAAGVVLAFVLGFTGYGAIALAAAIGMSLFERQNPVGLQMLMIVLTLLCLIPAVGGFQPVWLPWTGVGIFGFLALTAKL